MLTATYSLIALSNEQNAVRRILRNAQQAIRAAWQQHTDAASLRPILDQLVRFDALCRARKVEQYLIPAVRKATRQADRLLGELDRLTATAIDTLRSIGERLGRIEADGAEKRADLCGALDLYCRNMTSRLDREEDELFPIAQRVFSIEEWFALAEQFLSDDKRSESRTHHAGHLPMPAARPERLSAH